MSGASGGRSADGRGRIGVVVAGLRREDSVGLDRLVSCGFVNGFFSGKGRGVRCGAREVASSAGVFDAREVTQGGGALLEGDGASATSVAEVSAAGVAGGALVVGDDNAKAPDEKRCFLCRN